MLLPGDRVARALAILILWTGSAAGQQVHAVKEPSSDEDPLRGELERLQTLQSRLEQGLSAAETRLRKPRPQPAPAPPTAPSSPVPLPPVIVAPRFRFGRGSGFAFGTEAGETEVRFRVVLHFDGRAYLGDSPASPDTFLARRVRPFIEGTMWNLVDFRLMPDFAQGQAVLQDAYVELHPRRWIRLRGGRFMVPIGLEWLQSDSTIALVERSLATDLVPYRDLGAMLCGDLGDGTFSYQLALLNGAPDGGNGPDFDAQSDKDYVGRIFVRPLLPTRWSELHHLGLGGAASYGNAKGTATATNLASYHSTGQQTIFSYIGQVAQEPGAFAAGARWRVTPQLYWYIGPIGLLAEYVVSSQRVQRTDVVADIRNHAWNLTASVVLTGEHAAYEGVVPLHPVDFRHKNFGAFEIAGRYSELRLDPGVFPTFADPATSVQSARELAGGLNWYMTDYVRFMLSFAHTEFIGGAASGNRAPENALLGRWQIAL